MKAEKDNRLMRLACIVFLCVFSVHCYAQSDSIVHSSHRLQDVEVVAEESGYAQRYKSSVPVQMLDSASFLRMGIHDVTGALKHVAGITVRDYGGAGGMKTVSVRGMGSRHTAVLYDGVVQSDSQTGETDLSRFSLNQAAAVTMTIGDGDDIWQPARNFASAATLNIQPMTPPAEGRHPLLLVGCQTGSWGMLNPSFHYGQNLSPAFSIMAQGEYFRADNNYPFTLRNVALTTRERRHNSKMDAGRAELGTLWKGGHDQMLSVRVCYDDSRRRLPGIVRYYTSLNDEMLDERKMTGQFLYRRQLGEGWALKVCWQYNNQLTDYRNDTPGSAVRSGGYHQREGYGAASLQYEALRWLSFSASADVFRNALHGSGSVRKPVRNNALGMFAVKMKGEQLQLVGRLLGAWHQDKADGERSYERRLSPSVSLSYKPVKRLPLMFRAMYKEMFRMPSFGELYFFHLGSQTLSPERTRQWNAGLSWNKRQTENLRFALTVDAYLNHVTDKIVAIPFNTFIWRMQNLARVRSCGMNATAEAEWRLSPSHQLLLSGNYSWQKVENRTGLRSSSYGRQVAYTPTHTWCGTLTWMNPWVGVAMTANGLSSRWATNEHTAQTRMAGFAECDLSFWRTLKVGPVECTLRAAVLNLLDKQYDIVAHYPMPGRSWRVGVMMKM